eukprot:CAMPEP_0178443840 /NCGR_PEP_ID=MMETSP0689_2-20121128/39135_1 /TAXON_ID=160604 /ORGANISM="Amphidinium massartii, Strain CS-259" /LENGTH=539 /DNA_ID=CAMNT_0020067925 /DNA_START=36 /DNA_END=1652 /DNA_ORIENTATION=+
MVISDAKRRLSFLVGPLLGEESEEKEVNPFVNRTAAKPLSRLERCKLVTVAIVLLPLRILAVVCILLLGFAVAQITSIGLPKEHFHALHGKPLSGWRLAVFEIILTGRYLLLWSFGFMGITVKGRPASRKEAPIIVANHVSGLIEGMYLLRCATMAEAHYISNPVLGPIMKGTSAIAVDRNDPNSRQIAKEAILRRASDTRWPQTLVFPEGTCTNGTALVQFKAGAFAPGLPVQPVLFRYPSRSFDPSFTFPVTSAKYLLGMMLQLRNPMEVEYLPVYIPNETEKRNPILYAAGVQKKMAEALGVPATKHAAEDVALSLAAQRMQMPLETGMVQWQAITESLTKIRYRDANELLKRFRQMDREGKGRLDFLAFATAMQNIGEQGRAASKEQGSNGGGNGGGSRQLTSPSAVYSEEDLRHLFNLLDVSGDGFVDFREYLCGVAVLNGHGQTEEIASLKFVFECLSKGEDNFTKDQLADVMSRVVPGLEQARLEEYFAEADADHNGLISRDEFIAFATKHGQDLGLKARDLLPGLGLPERA